MTRTKTKYKDKYGKALYEGDTITDGEGGAEWEVRWNAREKCYCPWHKELGGWCAPGFASWHGKNYWVKRIEIGDKFIAEN